MHLSHTYYVYCRPGTGSFSLQPEGNPERSETTAGQKHITTMVNSITLSSDMSTLYLIDNGRSIDFPFNNPRGILIGSLKGQLSVATAIEPPTTEETAEGKTIKLPTEKAQWTMFYHIDTEVLGIIGASDIDIAISEPGGPSCNQNFFDLKDKSCKNSKNRQCYRSE